MIKYIIVLMSLFTSAHLYAKCSKFDYRKINHVHNAINLENEEFCIIYSLDKKIPLLVYSKRAKSAEIQRSDSFKEDRRLKEEYRSKLSDYYKSGYDRGHLFPAADASSESSMTQSFLLSNIAPQNPKFNRVNWRILEDNIRGYNDVKYVYTGVIPGDSIIGDNVSVPSYFYKVVIFKNCYVGYIGSNEDGTIKRINLKDLYVLNKIKFNIRLKECTGEF